MKIPLCFPLSFINLGFLLKMILDLTHSRITNCDLFNTFQVLSNMLTCVHNLAMGEVFMVGKRAGVDMKTMWDCIRASSGNSFVWETGGPMLMQGTYDPSFTIALQCKDNRFEQEIIPFIKSKPKRSTSCFWATFFNSKHLGVFQRFV